MNRTAFIDPELHGELRHRIFNARRRRSVAMKPATQIDNQRLDLLAIGHAASRRNASIGSRRAAWIAG